MLYETGCAVRLERLWADFNDADGEMVWTSLRRGESVPGGEPRAGQRIELWDHEGNTCGGIVVKVDYPIVYLRLDPSTWKDANVAPGEAPAGGGS